MPEQYRCGGVTALIRRFEGYRDEHTTDDHLVDGVAALIRRFEGYRDGCTTDGRGTVADVITVGHVNRLIKSFDGRAAAVAVNIVSSAAPRRRLRGSGRVMTKLDRCGDVTGRTSAKSEDRDRAVGERGGGDSNVGGQGRQHGWCSWRP